MAQELSHSHAACQVGPGCLLNIRLCTFAMSDTMSLDIESLKKISKSSNDVDHVLSKMLYLKCVRCCGGVCSLCLKKRSSDGVLVETTQLAI